MANIKDYPSITQYLDDTDDYQNSVAEINLDGERRLIVTQSSDFDGGQIIFRWDGEDWQPLDADTFSDVTGREQARVFTRSRTACSKSSDDDHDKVYAYMVGQVNKFSSKDGPDGGNLACVWAVRHIVYNVLKRWITRVDGTGVFDPELQQCYGSTWQEADTMAAGIIISPTVTMKSGKRNIGHIGLLGPGGKGTSRLIYSNSSARARWEQNFTLERWIQRYRDTKGLKVRFYPLPLYS